MRTFAIAAGLGAGLTAAASVALAHVMTNQQGNPGIRDIERDPGEMGLAFEDATFEARDGLRLSAWLLPAEAVTTAIVLVPGGGTNRLMGSGDLTLRVARMLTVGGHSVLMYDPRGTGRSGGSRMSYGALEWQDLAGAVDFLATRGYKSANVGVLGWSMGAATAMRATEHVRFGALALDSPLGQLTVEQIQAFISQAMALPRAAIWPLAAFIRTGGFSAAKLMWGMDLAHDPARSLRAHPLPTLVIHGLGDRLVLPSAGRAAAAAAGEHLRGAHFLECVAHVEAANDEPWYADTVVGFFCATLR